MYVYEVGSIYGPSYRYKVRITGDTVIQGHRYYIGSQNFPGYTENLVRVDSATGNIMTFKPGSNCFYYTNQYTVDSLSSKQRDTLKKCTAAFKSICIDTINTTLFGNSVKRKVFKQDDLIYRERYYCRNFGLYFGRFVEGDEVWHTLKGCKINGITYGDTLLTGIINISESVPEKFTLCQNYPNPFNPVTKIRFDIPANIRLSGNDKVTLKVYDILGKEIATLVNEKLQPGAYEVTWDASGFGSGIYFYKLTGSGISDTRKMVILK